MDPMPTATDTSSEQGWIALSPAHLLPWALLLLSLLWNLSGWIMPIGLMPWMVASWTFTVLQWLLGGTALAAGIKAREGQAPRRFAALVLAACLLALRLGSRVLDQAWSLIGLNGIYSWMAFFSLQMLGGLAALILLLGGRDEAAGGEFDAAVMALVMAGGMMWPALLVLAIATLSGHPLLAALGQALRAPQGALAREWHDGLDEGLRLRNLGAAALLFLLLFLALACSMGLGRSMHGFGSYGWSLGWTLVNPVAVLVASPLLGSHVLRAGRKAGLREGRGMALAALLLAGLLVLLVLAALVILVVLLSSLRGGW